MLMDGRRNSLEDKCLGGVSLNCRMIDTSAHCPLPSNFGSRPICVATLLKQRSQWPMMIEGVSGCHRRIQDGLSFGVEIIYASFQRKCRGLHSVQTNKSSEKPYSPAQLLLGSLGHIHIARMKGYACSTFSIRSVEALYQAHI